MAVTKGDMQAIGMGGWWITVGAAAGEPTLSEMANDGDGDAVTATVDGDAGVTNTLYYRQVGDTAWTEGENRAGDGDISQAGLDAGVNYKFLIVSTSGGLYSLPSDAIGVFVTGASEERVFHIESIVDPAERGEMQQILCIEER